MAIAPVLKTGVRKDLQVRILYPPFERMRRFFPSRFFEGRGRKLAGFLSLSFAVALLATAATPRSICACSMRFAGTTPAMKADLRNLVLALDDFFVDSGRFATSPEELTPNRYRLSTDVEWVSFSASADSLAARIRSKSLGIECWIDVGLTPDGVSPEYDGEVSCDPEPIDMYPIYAGAAYFALLLLAFVIRFVRAGRSLPAISGATLLRFLAACIIHPYWPLPRRDLSCYANAEARELAWVVLMGCIVLWMIFRGVELDEPPRAA
jgi:hypothetical protein